MQSMADRGFAPGLIFDVGAYEGEFARDALRVWPGAKVACFEPQDSASAMITAMKDDRIDLHRRLLGAAQKDAVVFNVCKTASSVLAEWHAKHEQVTYRQRTIDEVVASDYGDRPPTS
jgi:FkbM family methyltransferase